MGRTVGSRLGRYNDLDWAKEDMKEVLCEIFLKKDKYAPTKSNITLQKDDEKSEH